MYKNYDINDRENYYEQFTFPKNLLQFLEWKKDAKSELFHCSGHSFKFRNIEFGSSKKRVFEKDGKPRFFRLGKKFGDLQHEIAFYKDLMNEQKLISQLHFINDSFFYGCHTFHHLTRDKFPFIKNLLFEKYIINPGASGFDGINGIVDNSRSQIRIVDNVFLNLVYLSGEKETEELLQKCLNEFPGNGKSYMKIFTDLHNLL